MGYDSYAFLTGVIIFYVFYYSEGIMNAEGQTFGLYAYGAFATVVCVAIHHWQMFMNWRNWAPLLCALMALSIGLSFVTLALPNKMPASYLTGAYYGQLLNCLMFLLMILLATVALALPLYLAKSIRQVLLKPQFFEH